MDAWRYLKITVLFNVALAVFPALLSFFLGINVNYSSSAVDVTNPLLSSLQQLQEQLASGSVISLFSLPITIIQVFLNLILILITGNKWLFDALGISFLWPLYAAIYYTALLAFFALFILNRNPEA